MSADGFPSAKQLIETAARTMTEPQWEAFALVYVQEFTVREAAYRLGVDESAVRRRIERGIRRVRYGLADAERDPGSMEARRAGGAARRDPSEGGRTDGAGGNRDGQGVAEQPARRSG